MCAEAEGGKRRKDSVDGPLFNWRIDNRRRFPKFDFLGSAEMRPGSEGILLHYSLPA